MNGSDWAILRRLVHRLWRDLTVWVLSTLGLWFCYGAPKGLSSPLTTVVGEVLYLKALDRGLPVLLWYSLSYLGWHFRKDVLNLKSQSSKVSFHWNVAKETFELWALSFESAFENVTPSGIGCTKPLTIYNCTLCWAKGASNKASRLFRME